MTTYSVPYEKIIIKTPISSNTNGVAPLADWRLVVEDRLPPHCGQFILYTPNVANQSCEVRASAGFALLAIASYKLPEIYLCKILVINA